ncbi:MAG: hypothetical protein ABIS29_08450, partial [Vicinamibacterales bacterium]
SKIEDMMNKTKDSVEKNDDAMRELGLTFSSAFEDAITGGKSFSDILKGVEKDLLRIGTRKLVTEPVSDWFSQMMKPSGGGSSGGGDFLGGLLGGAKDFIGSIFGGGAVPSYAVGTSYVPRDMMAMVHRGEAIIPAGQNGGGATIVMNVTTPDAGSFRASRNQIAGEMQSALSASRRNR